MHLELWRCVARCRECCNHCDFSAFKIQAWAAIDVTKGELDQVASKVRRDIAQAIQHARSGFTINFAKLGQATFVAIFLVHRCTLHSSLIMAPGNARASGSARSWRAALQRIVASLRS